MAEAGEESGEALVDRREPLLGRGVELGARPYEVVVHEPGQPLLLGRQARRFAGRVHRSDALEELLVLRDAITKGRELGFDVPLDLLHGVITQRGAVDVVHRGGPIERSTGTFHGGDGVFEGRRRGVVGNRLQLLQMQRHAFLERRREQRGRGLVEWRHSAEGTRPGSQQRIVGSDSSGDEGCGHEQG